VTFQSAQLSVSPFFSPCSFNSIDAYLRAPLRPGKTGYIHAETYLRAQSQSHGQRDARPRSRGIGRAGRVGRADALVLELVSCAEVWETVGMGGVVSRLRSSKVSMSNLLLRTSAFAVPVAIGVVDVEGAPV
jgi:hypothetical protein